VRAQPVDATPSDTDHLFLEVVSMRPGRSISADRLQPADLVTGCPIAWVMWAGNR
jgi:hypothetical protein